MALLIGASQFPEDPSINAIPNVEANLNFLKKCLTDPELVGVPQSNIFISLNEDKQYIERKISAIVQQTRNSKYTLLVYYTGHGILSSFDYELYLATHNTRRESLESDAIDIGDFKKYIKRSLAGRKIVILDCCHSGAIIGSMGDISSTIQSGLSGFEGTYVMTSAAEDEPSLFPSQNPERPTYFTERFLDIVSNGLNNNREYCSLREIFDKIRNDFSTEGLPLPQQSNFNTADQIFFSKNVLFFHKKQAEEIEWQRVLQTDDKWEYLDFIEKFPDSVFVKTAKKKIEDIDELEFWTSVCRKDRVSSYVDYLENYPIGKFVNEAKSKISYLREKEKQQKIDEENRLREAEKQKALDEQAKLEQLEKQKQQKIYEENRLRKAEEQRLLDEQAKQEQLEKEKQQKINEENRLRKVEEQRLLDEQAKQEQLEKQKQQKIDEENRLKQAAETKRLLEERRKEEQLEIEKQQKIDEENRLREAERQTLPEEQRKRKNEVKVTIVNDESDEKKSHVYLLALAIGFFFVIVVIIAISHNYESDNYSSSNADSAVSTLDSTPSQTPVSADTPHQAAIQTDSSENLSVYLGLIKQAEARQQRGGLQDAILTYNKAYSLGKQYKFSGNQNLQAKISDLKNQQSTLSKVKSVQQEKAKYEIVDAETHGLIVVKLKSNGLYGAVNTDYEIIAPCMYRYPPIFPSKGIIQFQDDNGDSKQYQF